MKLRNIFGISLVAALALANSCTVQDMTKVDEWLGEKFNQEILWNVDSMAFRRTDWVSEDVASGVQVRKAQIKMWESVQSISYITYSPNTFNTYLGYLGADATVGEIAGADEKALVAINAGGFADGKPSNFLKVDNSVKQLNQNLDGQNGILGLTASTVGVSATISKNCDDYADYNSAIVTGPVLLREVTDNVTGVSRIKEAEFPEGEFYDTRMARTIFGITTAGNYVMAVIDGGVTGNADGATVKEAAFVARLMGCQKAILLGCGDESTIWSADKGVVNAPSAGSAQKVGSVIYIGPGTSKMNGSGTQDDPYLIENYVNMTQMRAVCKEGSKTYFRMVEDVDMSEVKTWTPANWDGEFTRQVSFDGNGKTITNFSPVSFVADDQTSPAGYPSLFGVLWGECKDLTIKDSKIVTTNSSVGFIGGFVGTTGKPATVENVHIVNCEIEGASNLAAIGGQSRESVIKNCTVDVKITATGTDCAGVVGKSGVAIEIDNVTAKVDITPTDALSGNQRHAGILGYSTGTTMTITNCSATGKIGHCINSTKTTGGICAYAGAETCVISQCAASVELTGAMIANSGGIVGIASNAVGLTVENCYSYGYVNPHQQYGGMVGRLEKGAAVIRNCYSTTTIDGYSGNGGIFGVCTAQSPTATLEIYNCYAWNDKIVCSREAADKYGSGALIGACACNVTVSACFRNPDMEFVDGFRTVESHADCSAKVLEGATNQQSHDSMPASESNLSALAQTAGWSAAIWDFSGAVPMLK